MNKDSNKHAKVDVESSQVLNHTENYRKLRNTDNRRNDLSQEEPPID